LLPKFKEPYLTNNKTLGNLCLLKVKNFLHKVNFFQELYEEANGLMRIRKAHLKSQLHLIIRGQARIINRIILTIKMRHRQGKKEKASHSTAVAYVSQSSKI